MREIDEILRRQAEAQQRLRDLSWPEKVRMIEKARHAVVTLRGARVVRRGSEEKRSGGEKG